MTLEQFETLVGTISERAFSSGWQFNIEERLWLIAIGAIDTDLAQTEISSEELALMRKHIEKDATWIVCENYVPKLVPLSHWLPLVDQFRKAHPHYHQSKPG